MAWLFSALADINWSILNWGGVVGSGQGCKSARPRLLARPSQECKRPGEQSGPERFGGGRRAKQARKSRRGGRRPSQQTPPAAALFGWCRSVPMHWVMCLEIVVTTLVLHPHPFPLPACYCPIPEASLAKRRLAHRRVVETQGTPAPCALGLSMFFCGVRLLEVACLTWLQLLPFCKLWAVCPNPRLPSLTDRWRAERPPAAASPKETCVIARSSLPTPLIPHKAPIPSQLGYKQVAFLLR